jgi:hypothetical protein
LAALTSFSLFFIDPDLPFCFRFSCPAGGVAGGPSDMSDSSVQITAKFLKKMQNEVRWWIPWFSVVF